MNNQDLSNLSMLDIFRSEVETHCAALNSGLLALEESPHMVESNIESLMRAAHSIKGGARIVDLDEAVKIAHTMEDCFVEVKKNKVKLSSSHIDLLFKGVDSLTKIAETAGDDSKDSNELEKILHNADKIADAIAAIATGQESIEIIEPQLNKTSQIPECLPPLDEPVESSSKSLEKERVVRVTAPKIERLMGLAGEVVVSARWLPPFINSLMILKKSHFELSNILDELQRVIAKEKHSERLQNLTLQAREKVRDCSVQLADRLNSLDMFTNSYESLSDRLYHEVIGVRMCPFSDRIEKFPRMVRDIARKMGKKVRLHISGESTEVDRDILEKLDAPLNHILRNAIDHGIEFPKERVAAGKSETGTINLKAFHRAGMLMITIADDGKGIGFNDLRNHILDKGLANADIVNKLSESELMDFLFLPGFSTKSDVSEISGRGVGLDVVHNIVHEVGGVVRAVSSPGLGLKFHLELPLTLSVIRTFLVEIKGEPYAFPLARIERCLQLNNKYIEIVEDRQYFRDGNDNIALVDIHEVLDLENNCHCGAKDDVVNVVIVSDRKHSYGLVADKFLGECDLVVRPLDSRLGKIPDISASAVMLDGSPVLIFDVEDLVNSIGNLLSGKQRLSKIESSGHKEDENLPKRILVVDDSFIVREKERKLLENKGYDVEVAVDGQDGWNLLRTSNFNMVVTDIDMPRMNGFELIRNMKQNDELKSLPVIIVSYKASENDRIEGLQAGANYYLTKTNFNDNSLINAVVDLIGEP